MRAGSSQLAGEQQAAASAEPSRQPRGTEPRVPEHARPEESEAPDRRTAYCVREGQFTLPSHPAPQLESLMRWTESIPSDEAARQWARPPTRLSEGEERASESVPSERHAGERASRADAICMQRDGELGRSPALPLVGVSQYQATAGALVGIRERSSSAECKSPGRAQA